MSDDRKKLGQAGEQLAADFLKRKGYTIVQRNFRCAAGELDIIARDNDYLVFVEVKTRRNHNYGSPLEAVDFRKQRQICRTALCYLQKHSAEDQNIRFDIIAITITATKPLIEHITEAFDSCL